MVKDSLYAIKTAKKAGFIVVAIEDENSISKKDEIKKHADYYIKDFKNLLDLLDKNILKIRGDGYLK